MRRDHWVELLSPGCFPYTDGTEDVYARSCAVGKLGLKKLFLLVNIVNRCGFLQHRRGCCWHIDRWIHLFPKPLPCNLSQCSGLNELPSSCLTLSLWDLKYNTASNILWNEHKSVKRAQKCETRITHCGQKAKHYVPQLVLSCVIMAHSTFHSHWVKLEASFAF